jgi:hypothetical protein
MALLVVVPYIRSGFRPEVFDALKDLPVGATLIPWQLEDEDYGYGRLLRSFWQKCGETHQDLCIIEQDVLVFRAKHDGETDTIETFLSCPELWCAHSYRIFWGDLAETYGGPFGLGCVRFRSQLMAAEPGLLMEALRRPEHHKFPAGHWMGLDSAVTSILKAKGYPWHQHRPAVRHVHEYQPVSA